MFKLFSKYKALYSKKYINNSLLIDNIDKYDDVNNN